MTTAPIRRSQPEYELHCAVAQFLDATLKPEVLWTSIEHSGVGARHGARNKAKGVKTGVPDIFISWAGRGLNLPFVLWIELKSGKGGASKEQQLFRERSTAIGHYWWMCWSVNDVESALRNCYVPTRIATGKPKR